MSEQNISAKFIATLKPKGIEIKATIFGKTNKIGLFEEKKKFKTLLDGTKITL